MEVGDEHSSICTPHVLTLSFYCYSFLRVGQKHVRCGRRGCDSQWNARHRSQKGSAADQWFAANFNGIRCKWIERATLSGMASCMFAICSTLCMHCVLCLHTITSCTPKSIILNENIFISRAILYLWRAQNFYQLLYLYTATLESYQYRPISLFTLILFVFFWFGFIKYTFLFCLSPCYFFWFYFDLVYPGYSVCTTVSGRCPSVFAASDSHESMRGLNALADRLCRTGNTFTPIRCCTVENVHVINVIHISFRERIAHL